MFPGGQQAGDQGAGAVYGHPLMLPGMHPGAMGYPITYPSVAGSIGFPVSPLSQPRRSPPAGATEQ